MTVRKFRVRLDALADELCCGTFWQACDFLHINPDIMPGEIAADMEYAEGHHDANARFNWWYQELTIEAVMQEQEGT